MSKKSRRIAIVYDFDGTLAPGNMQESGFLPDIGIDTPKKIKEFWSEVTKVTKKEEANEVLIYMRLMLEKYKNAKDTNKISKKYLYEQGKPIKIIQWSQKMV